MGSEHRLIYQQKAVHEHDGQITIHNRRSLIDQTWPCIRLDSYMDQMKLLNIDLLIINTPELEYSVLRSLSTKINNVKIICVKPCKNIFYDQKSFAENLNMCLRDYGFTLTNNLAFRTFDNLIFIKTTTFT